MNFPRSQPATRGLMAATILGLALLAAPGAARAVDLAPGFVGPPLILAQYAATPAAPTAKQASASAKLAPSERVEARIKDLHDKLRITAAQSAQWEPVAQAMRAGGVTMSEAIDARSAKKTSMTALDDLHSYQRVAQAHTDGLNSFVPAFATLYQGMSAEQKKNADQVFARSQQKSPQAAARKTE